MSYPVFKVAEVSVVWHTARRLEKVVRRSATIAPELISVIRSDEIAVFFLRDLQVMLLEALNILVTFITIFVPNETTFFFSVEIHLNTVLLIARPLFLRIG